MKKIAVIILAAGKSTRMKSELPKVLHPLCGRPVLQYVLDLVKAIRASKTVVVVGHKHEEVTAILPPGLAAARQKKLIGTADAVKCAMPYLKGFKGTVLVLYGDTPLLKKETISKMLKFHTENKLEATLLTAQLDKPGSYGRILRNKVHCIYGIVEEKDANDFQKEIKEINTGIICFDKESLDYALARIKPHNVKKEYYLTDAIGLLHKRSGQVDSMKITDIKEALGINSRVELAQAQEIMRKRINEQHMQAGVTLVDPAATAIDFGVRIGADTTIYPFTVVESGARIGQRCRIGPFTRVKAGERVGDGVCLHGQRLSDYIL